MVFEEEAKEALRKANCKVDALRDVYCPNDVKIGKLGSEYFRTLPVYSFSTLMPYSDSNATGVTIREELRKWAQRRGFGIFTEEKGHEEIISFLTQRPEVMGRVVRGYGKFLETKPKGYKSLMEMIEAETKKEEDGFLKYLGKNVREKLPLLTKRNGDLCNL
jgi:hypothetical protein